MRVEPDQAEYDAARTLWLEERGHRVIRLTNHDVHVNINGVLEAIRAACAKYARRDDATAEEND